MIWMLDTDTVGHVAEIQFDLASGDVSGERRGALAEFLDLFQLDDFPVAAGADYGEIRARLERAGRTIGPYDLLIAAHARHIRAALVTNNEAEFRRVPGPAVQNRLRHS